MMKIETLAFVLLAATRLAHGIEAAPSGETSGQLDAAAAARVFLEKTIAELTEKSSCMPEQLNLCSSSLRDLLDAELERRETDKAGAGQEVELLRELRHYLYGQLDSKLCLPVAVGPDGKPSLRVQNLRPGSILAKLASVSLAELSTSDTKLSELILDRRLKQIEFCKSRWDKNFIELFNRLDETRRRSLIGLYNNLIAYEVGRFAHATSAFSNAPDATDTALRTYHQFIKLVREPPRAASFVVYMNRIQPIRSLLELDENLRNARLDRETFSKALGRSVLPLCRTVCNHFRPVGSLTIDLFLALDELEIADEHEMHYLRSRFIKLFVDQPAQATISLVVQSACCKLIDGGETIRQKIWAEIAESDKGVAL